MSGNEAGGPESGPFEPLQPLHAQPLASVVVATDGSGGGGGAVGGGGVADGAGDTVGGVGSPAMLEGNWHDGDADAAADSNVRAERAAAEDGHTPLPLPEAEGGALLSASASLLGANVARSTEPTRVARRGGGAGGSVSPRGGCSNDGVAAAGSTVTVVTVAAPSASAAGAAAGAAGGDELTLRGALVSATFWLHFSVHFAISGSAFFLINNLAQVVRAIEPAAEASASAAALVSVLSACNCLGRLAGAWASELAGRLRAPRTAPFALAAALMGVAMVCVSVHSRAALLPACALCGFAFGALNALNACVVPSLYGLRSFGAIYTTIVLAGACGSALIANGLAVAVYDAHLQPGATACEGAGCFRHTALACALLDGFGCACATVLSLRVHRAAAVAAAAR